MKYFESFGAENFGMKYFFDRNPSVFPDISARFLDPFLRKAIENPSYKTAQFCRAGAIEKASRNVRENACIPIEELFQS